MGGHLSDIALGGVLMAPLVGEAVLALVIFFVLRAVLSRFQFDRVFANPNLVELCLFVIILAIVVTV